MKKIMIFGDSYSTHKEYIPGGYAHYYCTEGRSEKEPVTKMKPEETWWWRLKDATGAQIVKNDSWSGSPLSFTGWVPDCSTTSSFIYRYEKYCDSGFFEENEIDTIFVFGGTNDSWCGAPLGEEKYENFERNDFFSVLPSICYLMSRLKNDHPDKRIVFIANCGIKDEVVNCMSSAAARLGAECIKLHDIDKMAGHPTSLGMSQICDQVLEGLGLKILG